MRLRDMGTTGLVDYVAGHGVGRLYALAFGRATWVLRNRGYGDGAIKRFWRACNIMQARRLGAR